MGSICTDIMKLEQFKMGMDGYLKKELLAYWDEPYSVLVRAARAVESGVRQMEKSESKSSATLSSTNGTTYGEEERERLVRQGRCFICRRKGHLARDCPEGDSDEDGNEDDREDGSEVTSGRGG
jgi:hypothetical protein